MDLAEKLYVATDRPAGAWRPVLPPPLAEQALAAAEAIAADLHPFSRFGKRPFPDDTFSLSRGRAGVALYFAYLDRALPGSGYGELALELLDEATEILAELRARPELYSGFVGVAWLLEHLMGWLLDDSEDAGAETSAAVLDFVRQAPWQRDYDLISGLVGIGVYALERRPRPGAEECLRLVLDRLNELVCWREGWAAWETPVKPLGVPAARYTQEGNLNLGIAHGVPGVVAWLADVAATGLEVRSLLEGAVTFVLAHKMPPGSGAIFPYGVDPQVPQSRPVPSRLGWCYGDLGIAVALMNAARRTGNPAWEREAVAAMRFAAARRQDTGVIDAGICHGSAGLVHLFNRAYQASGDPAAAEAACYWAERTLGMRRPGEGVGGFLVWDVGDRVELEWRCEPGFLTGAAGIGLALLTAATPIEPRWDRLLLASIPDGSREPGWLPGAGA